MARAVWDDKFYIECYEHARSGMTRAEMPIALGVPEAVFRTWYKNRPALRDAIARGRTKPVNGPRAVTGQTTGDTFFEYVYRSLPEHLREIWNEMSKFWNEDEDTPERIEKCLAGCDTRARQHLYINALVYSNFNGSEASRKVNVPPTTVQRWMKDRNFKEVLDHVTTMKKDQGESLLWRKAQSGDTAAIIFINRTLNGDRGYNPKVNIRIEGEVAHIHDVLQLDDLSVDEKRMLLEAARSKRLKALPTAPKDITAQSEVIDAVNS